MLDLSRSTAKCQITVLLFSFEKGSFPHRLPRPPLSALLQQEGSAGSQCCRTLWLFKKKHLLICAKMVWSKIRMITRPALWPLCVCRGRVSPSHELVHELGALRHALNLKLEKKQEQTLFKDLRNRQDNGNIEKDPTLKKIYGTEVKEPCEATGIPPRREFRVGDGNYVEEKIFCHFPQTSSPHPNNSHSY